MKGDYTGKVLGMNLGTSSTGALPTERHEELGGGHGMGFAIFEDLGLKKAADLLQKRDRLG